jgi:protein TonB
MGWSGKVHVSFLIGKNGDISEIKVVKSSGFPVLDKCAIKTIRRIASFPKPPTAARVVLPINFKVNTRIVEAEI